MKQISLKDRVIIVNSQEVKYLKEVEGITEKRFCDMTEEEFSTALNVITLFDKSTKTDQTSATEKKS